RYDIPANWFGLIKGTCPDYAPMYIKAAVYSPEWQPFMESGALIYSNLNNPQDRGAAYGNPGVFSIESSYGRAGVGRTRDLMNEFFLPQAAAHD
ncbi:hypothetical protein, partial [Flavihumibacter cheonanensis]|uniref:hypothetical protein n=1 Tax=Flavihumibacter cheonanensis TaxID=1442385 RepID=UPI001EF96CCC